MLRDSGVTPEQTAAARAYLASFTTADHDDCFREVSLVDAQMEAKQDVPFAVAPGTKRVVIAIDGSGSMAARIGGRSKLDLARESTLAFIDGLGPDVDAALLVFGQQGGNAEAGKAKSCAGIDEFAPMGRDRAALAGAVRQAMTARRDAYQAKLKGARDASVDALKAKEKGAE